ncbi:hypothetical protein [Pedococcus sp. 5OH_020]|uniref:hypothetical protein n=1 Tax=Pedococcus sp. 5OH_020 TaxID=2989814 RepID=UPI0022E9C2D7|nr:hypothetical protein [Pedococcus sp. 5OH_020]
MSGRTVRERLGSQSLRAGSVRVAVGLAFYGAATYLYLGFAASTLGVVRYADFALFWGLVYGLGLGACLPLEQELSRRVSEAREAGRGSAPIMSTAYRLGGLVVVVLAVVMLVALPLVTHGDLRHAVGLWSAVVTALAGLVAMYISRGRLSGQRRFAAYSAQLGVEGAVRVLACLSLAALAVAQVWVWMLIVPLALLFAVAVTSRARELTPRPEPALPLRELGRSIAAVMVCTVVSQSLVNFGPVVVRLLSGPSQQALAGRFLAAALLARLPIFAFAAVQAVLVPHLVGAVVRGDRRAFVRSLTSVLLPTIGLGLLGVLVCATAGPLLLGLLGRDYQVSQRDLVLLALSVALFLGTLVLQPAAISLAMHWQAAAAWAASAVVFALLCLLPLDPLLAVEVALLVSCACALLLLLLVTGRGLPRLLPGTGSVSQAQR